MQISHLPCAGETDEQHLLTIIQLSLPFTPLEPFASYVSVSTSATQVEAMPLIDRRPS